MRSAKLIGVLYLLLMVGHAPSRPIQSGTFVIANATLIDGNADAPRPGMSVLVDDGLIVTVAPSAALETPAGATTIEADGMFLIPGLWDMHAHLSYWGEDALELLVSAGVTSIRELGGDPDEIGAWRAEIEAGDRPGPAMIWCGPFLEGPDGGEEYRFKVFDEAEVRYAARALQALDVDFLKIQPRIDPALVAALVDEGSDLGLSVVGHLPEGMAAAEGAALGLRSIEHMSPYMSLTDAELDDVIAAYKEHGTWMSPALYSMVAPLEARGATPADSERIRRAYAIVERFHAAGVPLLVGSNFAYRDWPQTPGSGLHGEMRVLVEAGISALDVIKLSTSGAAAFAGRAGQTGSIRERMVADMVLLEANPLEDIRNTERIVGVFLRGAWRPR
jgi:imidazolonepropionase-like amidohydrolase